ncbi:ankyrin repeat-containing domain protein [Aspergillus californicus]
MLDAGANLEIFECKSTKYISGKALARVENPLLRAVHGGHIQIVEMLLFEPPPLDLLRAAFHGAIRARDTELVGLIIRKNTPLVRKLVGNRSVYSSTFSPLGLAVKTRCASIVTQLLVAGADYHSHDEPNPFAEAISHSLDILEILLKHFGNPGGDVPLRYAAKENNKAAVDLFIQYGFDVATYGHYPLFHAIMRGHAEIVELLIDHGANPHLASDHIGFLVDDHEVHITIWYAVFYRRIHMIEILLARGVRPDRDDLEIAVAMDFSKAVAILSGLSYDDVLPKKRVSCYIQDSERAREKDAAFQQYRYLSFLSGPCPPSDIPISRYLGQLV